MEVTLNGKRVETQSGVKLSEFLVSRGLDLGQIVVEYNFDIAKKEDWDKMILKENDSLEVLRFVGGG